MFAFLTRRAAAPPPAARKTMLGVSALEMRECPAVLLPKPTHDLVSAPPAPPTGVKVAHPAPVQTDLIHARPLNPQPLPP